MVIDTSALLAILQDEPERRRFNEAIEAASERVMSVASYVEVSLVIESRYGAEGLRDLDYFIARAKIDLIAVDGISSPYPNAVRAAHGQGAPAASGPPERRSRALWRCSTISCPPARRRASWQHAVAGAAGRTPHPAVVRRDPRGG